MASPALGPAADILKSIGRFPLWWYSDGLLSTARRLAQSVQYYARTLAIGVWLRNIFVPMYGFRDWQSRIISVFMRSAQIVFRGIAVVCWALLCLVQFLVYIALPLAAVVWIAYFLVYAGAN